MGGDGAPACVQASSGDGGMRSRWSSSMAAGGGAGVGLAASKEGRGKEESIGARRRRGVEQLGRWRRSWRRGRGRAGVGEGAAMGMGTGSIDPFPWRCVHAWCVFCVRVSWVCAWRDLVVKRRNGGGKRRGREIRGEGIRLGI